MRPPAIRTDDESFIEIDVKRGKHPYIHLERALVDGKERWLLVTDCNEGGQVVGEGAGISVLALSPKKMRALRNFLAAADLGD